MDQQILEVVVGKLEPVDDTETTDQIIEVEDEDVKTATILSIVPINQIPKTKLENGIISVTNTDGNLEINSFENEEVIEETHYVNEEEIETEEDPNYDDEIGEYIMEDGSTSYMETSQEFTLSEIQDDEDEEMVEDEEEEDDVQEYEDNPEDADYEMEGTVDADFEYDEEDVKDLSTIEGFLCEICDRVFKSEPSFNRHNTVCHSTDDDSHDPLAFDICACCGEPSDTAHASGVKECEECDTLFSPGSSKALIIRHRVLEHCDGNGIFKCLECKADNKFKSKEAIGIHMRTLHPLAKTFSCKLCCRDFTRKYHLDRHVAQTGCHGAPRIQFQCEVCQRMFNRKDNLRDHLRAHAAGQLRKKKKFICSHCDKQFQSAALLQVHVRTHTGEKPFNCDLCPKKFPSSGAMKKHRRMHTGEKPYACIECKKRFAAKETLNRHVRTHTGEKPHSCTFCGKSFIQAAQLRAHIFHHTGENAFTCEECGRAFNRRVRLTTHMRFVHQGEKPILCTHDGCKRTFYRREDLARHVTLHSGDRPFECSVCEKTFSVKSSLKLHMLTHRKEQPCSCEECGRAFIRQDCLMRHMRAKHRNVLEDILAGEEKQRLQKQLISAATDAARSDTALSENHTQIWSELTLTDSIRELLGLLVDESTLTRFGWPDAPVDRILDSVIQRCGHSPANDEDFDYISRMRENAKLLFTVVIDDQAVKALLNNQTVDEVILHVLKLAKKD